jgi:hypothetical protein
MTMGFMIPTAEYFAAYHVETNCGTEIVPEDVCGSIVDVEDEGETGQLAQYCEGSRVESVERKQGWYARLSAPGYSDCTGWDGPYDTSQEALDAVKEFYDVDDDGDDYEGAPGVVEPGSRPPGKDAP